MKNLNGDVWRDDRSFGERFRRWRRSLTYESIVAGYGHWLWTVLFFLAKVVIGLFCAALFFAVAYLVYLVITS